MERIRLQLAGVQRRAEQLAGEYLLDSVDLDPAEWFVDVGANIGEVSRIVGLRFGSPILAIEPEPLEVRALAKNLERFDFHIATTPAWARDENIPWYSRNESGDSSLIAASTNLQPVTRPARRLDTILPQYVPDDARIGLLKVEAEGAEPEVLAGAELMLSRTRWVVADLGPERGESLESTVVPCVEMLQDLRFRLVDFHRPRTTFLFQNRDVHVA